MYRKVFIFWLLAGLCLFGSLNAVAANLKVDSLRKVLFRTDDPKEKIRLYLKLAVVFEKEQSDSAQAYLGSARVLALQIDDPKLIGQVYYAMGNHSVVRNQLDLALADFKVAANCFHRSNDTLGYARMHMLMGNIMGVRDDIGGAMANFIEAISLAEQHHYYNILSHLYNNMGEMYLQSDNRKKAMEYYTKAMNLFIRNRDFASVGNAWLNIGYVYYYLGNNEMARNYANRAQIVFIRENDNINGAWCLMILGMIETGQGNYQKAMELFENSLKLYDKDTRIYSGPKDVLHSELHIRIGINHLRMGNYGLASGSLLEGLRLARSMKLPRMVILATENLSFLFEKTNNDKEALRYYKLYSRASDSLSKIITVRSVEITEIRQAFLKKQHENELRIQYDKSRRKITLIIYIISGVILLAVIIILFLLLKLERNRKRQADIEKKVLDEKLEFQNREMTTNVMYINKMNEQVVDIAEKLKALSIDEGSPNAQVIRSIIKDLGQGSQGDAWKEFEVRFQNVHSVFYRNLTEKYPDLTPNDLKMCAFLRLNMSTKEISALTYQTKNSIMVARTRLRQKLALSRNENLITFLSQF